VPTLQETGLNVTAVVAYGLTAPARTPDAVIARLTQALSETMNDKAVADRFRELGFDLNTLLGSAYRDFIVQDLEQWRGVAKATNTKIEN
jgi:tripartite-type tricarboxylate transporter receptor subunit TctC